MMLRRAWCVLLVGVALGAGAQSRVLLNVQVTDAEGHAVPGLTAQDFELKITHQPQKISMFRAVQDGGDTAKDHAFLVIDALNNSESDVGFTRKEIEKYARALKAPLPIPVAIAVLSENGLQIGTSTRDGVELARQVALLARDLHPNDCTGNWNSAALGIKTMVMSPDDPIGRSRVAAEGNIGDCLNHRFQFSLLSMRDFVLHQVDVPGRAIVIWMGPGWPALSGPEFEPDTPQLRANDFANVVQMLTALREAQVTLDAVSWASPSRVTRFDAADFEAMKGGTPASSQASGRSLAMPVLAHLSGGQVYFNRKGLSAEIAACLTDADSYYVIGFDSAPPAAAHEFRPIEVTVDRPGVTVRTARAYYAEP